jgi:hypothetical protein
MAAGTSTAGSGSIPSQNPYNITNTPGTFRVGGSGFTTFLWSGSVIGFAQTVSHQSPQPVAAPSAIQPMDQQYPMQIMVPAAIGAGTLQVQLFELYNQAVWDNIMSITDLTTGVGTAGKQSVYNDLSEVFLRLSALNKPITATKIIYPPNAGVRGGQTTKFYAEQYLGCMITDIRNDETIQIGTMEVIKNMTIMYTQMVRQSATSS